MPLEPWVFEQLKSVEIRDYDCDVVRGSLVDWSVLRERIQNFDQEWGGAPGHPPIHLCPRLQGNLGEVIAVGDSATLGWDAAFKAHETSGWAWDAAIVLGLLADAVEECALGAMAVAVLLLVCTLDCGGGVLGQTVEALFRQILTKSPETNRISVEPYTLSSSSWPVANLLAKWGKRCSLTLQVLLPNCSQVCRRFLRGMTAAAQHSLLPMITRDATPEPAIIYDPRIDAFSKASLRALDRFDKTNKERKEQYLHHCPTVKLYREALMLYVRFLGPPVTPQSRDPLWVRGQQLSIALVSVTLEELLVGAWPALAAIAAAHYSTWRSHRLYPGSQVVLEDVRNTLRAAVQGMSSSQSICAIDGEAHDGQRCGLAAKENGRRNLWKKVAFSGEEFPLGALWRRAARWLIAAPEDTPNVICLSMAWGGLHWVSSFLRRALSVGVPRFVFATTDMMPECKVVESEQTESWRLLCVRASSHYLDVYSRPYDTNNYAKFFMMPMFLSLGIDIAWLDVDIYLFRNPLPRLLRQAYGLDGRGGADVLTTDHFAFVHLNHGVFFVKALDRTLLWSLQYIKWLHVNPVAHDQNGWDAFLGHTVRFETHMPFPLSPVSFQLLDTAFEYLTLSGWAGTSDDFGRIQLLHFTGAGNTMRKKIRGPMSLVRLFNRTGEDSLSPKWAEVRRKRVLLHWLRKVQAPMPEKDVHYEGIHAAAFWPSWDEVGLGGYSELFA